MKRQQFADIAALLFIILFSYTAFSKLFDMTLYIDQINKQPFDDSLTPFLVLAIPGAELLVVLALIIPRFRLLGLQAATGLMLAFTVYILLIIMHVFHTVPCSCGGVIQNFNWEQHLIFNLFFLLLGAAALMISRKKEILKYN